MNKSMYERACACVCVCACVYVCVYGDAAHTLIQRKLNYFETREN